MSGIEWTDATWNPVVGCTRVSAGCDRCYAVAMSHRLEAMGRPEYAGLTVLNAKGERHFNGTVRCLAERLGEPLKWKKPRRVFVNSMSDLFHRDVPFEFIDRVFAVMALCPRHQFQVLTKRPERAAEYLADLHGLRERAAGWAEVRHASDDEFRRHGGWGAVYDAGWPLPNVWLGASAEDQGALEERAPQLLACPAAVRFLSLEPLLGPVDLDEALYCLPRRQSRRNAIHWVIVGGESGGGARACDVSWIDSVVRQCADAGVPCFVKQLGARPTDDELHTCGKCWYTAEVDAFDVGGAKPGKLFCTQCHAQGEHRFRLRDRKGGEPGEWPEDLRVRQWPGKVTA